MSNVYGIVSKSLSLLGVNHVKCLWDGVKIFIFVRCESCQMFVSVLYTCNTIAYGN